MAGQWARFLKRPCPRPPPPTSPCYACSAVAALQGRRDDEYLHDPQRARYLEQAASELLHRGWSLEAPGAGGRTARQLLLHLKTQTQQEMQQHAEAQIDEQEDLEAMWGWGGGGGGSRGRKRQRPAAPRVRRDDRMQPLVGAIDRLLRRPAVPVPAPPAAAAPTAPPQRATAAPTIVPPARAAPAAVPRAAAEPGPAAPAAAPLAVAAPASADGGQEQGQRK